MIWVITTLFLAINSVAFPDLAWLYFILFSLFSGFFFVLLLSRKLKVSTEPHEPITDICLLRIPKSHNSAHVMIKVKQEQRFWWGMWGGRRASQHCWLFLPLRYKVTNFISLILVTFAWTLMISCPFNSSSRAQATHRASAFCSCLLK